MFRFVYDCNEILKNDKISILSLKKSLIWKLSEVWIFITSFNQICIFFESVRSCASVCVCKCVWFLTETYYEISKYFNSSNTIAHLSFPQNLINFTTNSNIAIPICSHTGDNITHRWSQVLVVQSVGRRTFRKLLSHVVWFPMKHTHIHLKTPLPKYVNSTTLKGPARQNTHPHTRTHLIFISREISFEKQINKRWSRL